MFWIFLTVMAFIWFITPHDDNVWTILDEKPKRYKWYSESSINKKKFDYKKSKHYYVKKYGYKNKSNRKNSNQKNHTQKENKK